MSDRSCPACHEPVLAHQTLCPVCRTPVPSEAGPVATGSTAFTFTAPPPRRAAPAPAPAPRPEPEPVPSPDPVDPGTAGPFVVGPSTAATAWSPGPDATAVIGAPAPAWNPGPAPPATAPTVSAGTLGTPGAAGLDERGNLPGGVVGLVAAALVTIGVFLPWISVEGRDVSGWAASGDAKVLLGIAGVATVIAALLIGGARSLVLRLAMVGLGIVALGFGVFEISSATGIDDVDVSLGTGLFLVLAGGLALGVAGVVTRHRRFL